jgi:ribose-phosphate pyrophosphokinase
MKDVVLMADPESNAWNFAKKISDYIADVKEEKIYLGEIIRKEFNNGEIKLKSNINIRKKDVYFLHDSKKKPQEWWVDLLLFKDLALNSSAENLIFVLPNMLYSRQDRKDEPHVPISARALANSISPGLKRIITMDLHAPQIQGFYPANVPLDNLYSFPEVVPYLEENHSSSLENLVVVSPDMGGADRVKSFLKRLRKSGGESLVKQDYSFALMHKTREEPGKIGSMELIGDVQGKNALIVDDIIDSGGTACEASNLLRKKGAKKIMIYGTHGLFTGGTENLLEKFDSVMTSNTYYRENDGIEVIDVTPTFAEAIYRAQKGLSISKLFD